MSAELVAFLHGCLDRDAAAAQRAHDVDPGPWEAGANEKGDNHQRDEPHGTALLRAADGVALWDCEGSGTLCMAAPTGIHIARHDPTRTLADIDAKRRIIALHGPVTLRGGAGAKYFDTATVCRSCEPPQFPEHASPCPTLRLLALPYRDEPGYLPAWAPE